MNSDSFALSEFNPQKVANFGPFLAFGGTSIVSMAFSVGRVCLACPSSSRTTASPNGQRRLSWIL